MSNPGEDLDLEVQVNQRIRETLKMAGDRIGWTEFSKIVGVPESRLHELVERSEYVPMTLVSLACQLNKNRGDTELYRTSISECVKGATIKLPPAPKINAREVERPSRGRRGTFATSRSRRGESGPFMDQKSGRLLGFGANLITFLILGYFLGGFALNPILGLPSCDGLAPCEGSVVGLAISSVGSLAYTYYYFVKKL